MNLALAIQILEAIVADTTTFEAGSPVTTPAFALDLSALGIGKLAVTVTVKKTA